MCSRDTIEWEDKGLETFPVWTKKSYEKLKGSDAEYRHEDERYRTWEDIEFEKMFRDKKYLIIRIFIEKILRRVSERDEESEHSKNPSVSNQMIWSEESHTRWNDKWEREKCKSYISKSPKEEIDLTGMIGIKYRTKQGTDDEWEKYFHELFWY